MNLETTPHKYNEAMQWWMETPLEGKTALPDHFKCWHLSLRFITDPALVLAHEAYWAKCGESRFFCFLMPYVWRPEDSFGVTFGNAMCFWHRSPPLD